MNKPVPHTEQTECYVLSDYEMGIAFAEYVMNHRKISVLNGHRPYHCEIRTMKGYAEMYCTPLPAEAKS